MSGIKFEELKTPVAIQQHFGLALSDTPTLLKELVWYYDEATKAMVSSGAFEEDEARSEAASAACRGLASAVRAGGSTFQTVTLHRTDAFIREHHDLPRGEMPWDGPDPLTRAFYEELKPHLRQKGSHGERSDGWQ